jgi:hypothetical protein
VLHQGKSVPVTLGPDLGDVRIVVGVTLDRYTNAQRHEKKRDRANPDDSATACDDHERRLPRADAARNRNPAYPSSTWERGRTPHDDTGAGGSTAHIYLGVQARFTVDLF